MKVSEVGRRLIERNEGCVLYAYLDIVGVPTIGYGHTEDVRMGQVITQAQADKMLSDDLNKIYGPKVEAALHGAPTTQSQFDAMVSLAYNIGTGGFAGSTVCRKHRAGDYAGAAAAFAAWNKAGGKVVPALSRRRREEAELYNGVMVDVLPKPAPYDRNLVAKALQTALLPVDPTLVVDGKWGAKSRVAYNRFNGER